MGLIKKFLGKILNGVTKFISFIFDVIINIFEIIVSLVRSIGRGLIGLISMGGCLFLFLFSPYALALLFNPVITSFILLLIIIPILGTKFVSYLKYIKYIITEYLFDRADSLIHGRKARYDSWWMEIGTRGWKGKAEARTRKRQEEQQRQWEERFKQWYEYQNYQRGTGGYSAEDMTMVVNIMRPFYRV